MITPFVTRFAPSPNGELHLGHALSAITAHDLARRYGGRFLVRIEDIDRARTREEYVAQIDTDLRWLGLDWERPVLRQSTRFDAYRSAIEDLATRGLLYPCFATRSEIEAAIGTGVAVTDPDGSPLYPGLCKNLSEGEIARRRAAGEPFCLRLDMDRALTMAQALLGDQPLTFREWDGGDSGTTEIIVADPSRWGDAVIVRKDTPASYNLAVVLDDAHQGVSHVVRGRDLFPATDLHRLLQVLLGLPEPVYHHHRLILDSAGQKLSKSLRHTALRALREAGISPSTVREQLGA